MTDLVSWLAFGVSVASAVGSLSISMNANKESARANEQNLRMAASQGRIADAVEKNFTRITRRVEVAGLPGNGAGSPGTDVKWDTQSIDLINWSVRNVGTDTAHHVRIDNSHLEVEACVAEGDWSAVHPLASVNLRIEKKFGVPLPDELLISWDEHPEPVAIPLPKLP